MMVTGPTCRGTDGWIENLFDDIGARLVEPVVKKILSKR